MTKQEINEKYFGQSALAGQKLNREESQRALKIITAKADSKKINAMVNNSKNFFESFNFNLGNAR